MLVIRGYIGVVVAEIEHSGYFWASPFRERPKYPLGNESTSIQQALVFLQLAPQQLLSIYLSIDRSIDRSIDLSIYLSIYLSIIIYIHVYCLNSHSNTIWQRSWEANHATSQQDLLSSLTGAEWQRRRVCRCTILEAVLAQFNKTEYTLWLFNIAMENCPFIDGLPIKHGGSFMAMLVITRG